MRYKLGASPSTPCFNRRACIYAVVALCVATPAGANAKVNSIRERPDLFASHYLTLRRGERRDLQLCWQEIQKGPDFFQSAFCKIVLNRINEFSDKFRMGALDSRDLDQFRVIVRRLIEEESK